LRIRTGLLLFIAATLGAQMIDGVAVLVKNEPITLYQIEQTMQQEHLSADAASDLLIRQKLEAEEIKVRGLSVSDSEVFAQISQLAQRNGLSVSQLYDAVRSTQGVSADEFRKQYKENMMRQKLFDSIAYATMEEPDDAQLQEFYRLHADQFSHPDQFEVTLYTSGDERALRQKIANPMYQTANIRTEQRTLHYDRVQPGLAALLERTKQGEFTAPVPDPSGGYVSFFIRGKSMPVMVPFEQAKALVGEAYMKNEREQVLKDYFERARLDADVKILRLPGSEQAK